MIQILTPVLTPVLKVVHVLASTVFVGNILVSFVWNQRASRTGDARVAAFASELMMETDKRLLTPAVFVLVVTGNVVAVLRKIPVWTTPLLAAAVGLFILSGVVWALFLVPVQKRQLALSAELRPGGTLPEEYGALKQKWMSWAPVAIALGVGAQVFMALA